MTHLTDNVSHVHGIGLIPPISRQTAIRASYLLRDNFLQKISEGVGGKGSKDHDFESGRKLFG